MKQQSWLMMVCQNPAVETPSLETDGKQRLSMAKLMVVQHIHEAEKLLIKWKLR